MEIGRRELLGGATSLGLASMVGPLGSIPAGAEDLGQSHDRWHPFTRSLLERASRAGRELDRPRVERILYEVAEEHGRPVIKWTESAERAFEHLRRYSLDELTQMPTARLWSPPWTLPILDNDRAERSFDVYWHATQVLSVEEYGTALIAPKLASKSLAIASLSDPESIFETRAVAAEIGWIETCLPAVAARAIRAVEDLLSDGHAEGSESIYHQLRAFEAFEHGLLATWETPDGLVCVPRHV
jgi:hypothetical protein